MVHLLSRRGELVIKGAGHGRRLYPELLLGPGTAMPRHRGATRHLFAELSQSRSPTATSSASSAVCAAGATCSPRRWRCPTVSTRTATRTTPAPIQNGACTLTFSPSLPASHGATAPPENRTNEYAAEATGRSTGAAPITAWVISVLLTPRNAPATTMPTTSTALESVNTAITARSTANSRSAPTTEGSSPIRASSHGAATTEVKASSSPQPKKIQPTCEAAMSSGKGAKASSVKKPTL